MVATLLHLFLLSTPPIRAQETPREIVDRGDRLLRGESSRRVVMMEIPPSTGHGLSR